MELQMLADGQYCQTGEFDPIRLYCAPLVGRMYCSRVIRCVEMLPTGRDVLEIGYGSGVSFLSLAKRFQRIHGVDLHRRCDGVTDSFRDHNLDLDLRQGSIFRLPYADESMDAALAISLHEHLEPRQQAAAFAEVQRVLRPGGCYVVGVPGVNALMTLAFRVLGVDIREHHLTTQGQVLVAMRDSFAVDKTHCWPWMAPTALTAYLCMRGYKP